MLIPSLSQNTNGSQVAKLQHIQTSISEDYLYLFVTQYPVPTDTIQPESNIYHIHMECSPTNKTSMPTIIPTSDPTFISTSYVTTQHCFGYNANHRYQYMVICECDYVNNCVCFISAERYSYAVLFSNGILTTAFNNTQSLNSNTVS